MSESVIQELNEYYDLREALETHAVVRLASGLPLSDCRRMDDINNEMVSLTTEAQFRGWTPELADRWLLADAAFHLLLLRAAGNRCLLQFVNEVQIVTGIFGTRQQMVIETDHKRVYQEHREIIGSIRRQDASVCRRLISEHLQKGLTIILEAIHARRDSARIERLASVDPEDDFAVRLIALERQLMDGTPGLKEHLRFDEPDRLSP